MSSRDYMPQPLEAARLNLHRKVNIHFCCGMLQVEWQQEHTESSPYSSFHLEIETEIKS